MRLLYLLALATIGLPTPASADDCAHAPDQQAMNQCADRNYKQSDAALNVLYAQIGHRLENSDPDIRKRLVAAQRAWIGFRDAECKFATSASAGGSISPMLYAECADMLTRKRMDDFKAYLRCPEGDMSCPVPAP